MTEHQINCILTLARTLNFREAAEEISITQPTLTYQISQAEDEIGIKLFNRDKKAVSVTEDGQRIIEELKPIYEKLSGIKNLAKEISQEKITDIRIAHYDSANDPLLVPLIQNLCSKFPEVVPSLAFGNYYTMEDLLYEGKADIIFTNSALIKKEKTKSLILEKGPVYAYLSKDNPLSEKDILRLDDVEGEAFLLQSLNKDDLFCWHARYFAEHPEKYVLKKYATREERLFRANLGEGIMLSGYKIEAVPENAVVIPFVDGDDTSSCVACLESTYKKIKPVIDFIQEFYASRPS